MAIALVARGTNFATSTTVVVANGTTTGTGGTTPTSGNLLIAWANSDATVTMSGTGYTAITPIVDGNGCYVWYKVAGGSEPSSLTFTPSTSDTIVAGYEEWSGLSATPFDKSTSFTGSGAGSSMGAMSITPAVAGELLWWITMGHNTLAGGAPTSPAWSTYTLGTSTGNPGTLAAACWSIIGTQVAAGTSAVSDTNTWTTALGDRNGFVLAFKAAGAAVAYVPHASMVRQAVNRAASF